MKIFFKITKFARLFLKIAELEKLYLKRIRKKIVTELQN